MARQDPYLHDDVPVLKNLPGIKNSEALKQAEGDLTKMSMGIKPRAQGRAYRIEKRMSHISVVLDEK